MIDPDGFFIKLFPTIYNDMAEEQDLNSAATEIGFPAEDVREMPIGEFGGRLAAARTLRIVEAALSQVKKIREDRDRDFQRNHR